jgi:hypothetical protein
MMMMAMTMTTMVMMMTTILRININDHLHLYQFILQFLNLSRVEKHSKIRKKAGISRRKPS